MPGLDRDQPAELTAEHKDSRDPQRTTGSEVNDTKPADGVTVGGPELLPVRVGRQICSLARHIMRSIIMPPLYPMPWPMPPDPEPIDMPPSWSITPWSIPPLFCAFAIFE
jgi:hypothetical protein